MSASPIQYDAISTSHTASASLVRANTPLFSALSAVLMATPTLWDSTRAALPVHLHHKGNEGQRKRTGLECAPPLSSPRILARRGERPGQAPGRGPGRHCVPTLLIK